MLVLAMEFSRDDVGDGRATYRQDTPEVDRQDRRGGRQQGIGVAADTIGTQRHRTRKGPVGGVPPENGTEVAQQLVGHTLEDESC